MNLVVFSIFSVAFPISLPLLAVQAPSEEMDWAITQPIAAREGLQVLLLASMPGAPPPSIEGKPAGEAVASYASSHKLITVLDPAFP